VHKLNRPAAAPACLASYHHGRHNWSAVSPADKDQIRGSLKTMQQNRCAYCEQALRDDACHIEHFRQRGRYPQGTFQWSNLYLSCNRESTCGKHKDKQHYAPADLLDPCTDNPDDYLRFYSDGQIRPRADLAAPNQHRAAETIRVFNLASPELVAIRASELQGWIQIAEELQEWLEFDETEYQAELNQQLHSISGQPFETAIRHLFAHYLP
jgi:TIGR02646 family protein